MAPPAVVVGIGEMGAVFARALLRAGHPVHPVTRQHPIREVAADVPEPERVVVTVPERELDSVLGELPPAWRTRAVLLQNELLPRDWARHGLGAPTVAVVWFEKKKGTPIRVVLPTVVAGPAAGMLATVLEGIGVPARTVEAGPPLTRELVTKNVYILTTNIAGLDVGGDVTTLWRDHRELAREVASEVLDVQEGLVGAALPRDTLMEAMVHAFEADPGHKCTGRSAPGRLARAVAHADALGLAAPRLRALHARHG